MTGMAATIGDGSLTPSVTSLGHNQASSKTSLGHNRAQAARKSKSGMKHDG